MRVLTSAALCSLQQVGGDAEDAGGDRHDVLAGLVLDEGAVTVQTALAVLWRAATTHKHTKIQSGFNNHDLHVWSWLEAI